MSLTPKILSCAVMMALAGTAAAANTNSPAVGRALGLIATHGAATRATANDSFVASDAIVDASGEHVRFDRQYKGLPVIGGDLVVHSKGGQFKSASLTQGAPLNVNTHAKISSADAIVAAGAHFGSNFVGTPTASLVVYALDKGAAKLAYQVKMDGVSKQDTAVSMTYFIDANTGKPLKFFSNLETTASAGTGRTIYSGNVALTTNSITGGYEMRDPSRGGGYTVNGAKGKTSGLIYTDADNTWGNNAQSDVASAAADAQYGVSKTWDYYKLVHGRNGIANDGNGAKNVVHYGRNYVNAYWSDSCFCMTYGDGDGVTYGPLVNLDVAGHEMSHGVTSRTSKLVYSGESGGLNEANSDIMGTMVEYYAANTNDPGDYLIGEKIYLSNPGNLKALRWMFKPSRDTRSPDCYTSTIGSLDVHYSSGVANHFFYLLAEGAVNPAGFSYTPAQLVCNGNTAAGGIGRAKAEKIWFRGMTVYMTSNTNYAGARAATLQAAADLYGAGSAEQNAVAASWSAVSVN